MLGISKGKVLLQSISLLSTNSQGNDVHQLKIDLEPELYFQYSHQVIHQHQVSVYQSDQEIS